MSCDPYGKRGAGSGALLLPVAICLLLSTGLTKAQQRPATVVDKMVVVINGNQLIMLTDLLWQMALQPDTPVDLLTNPRSEDLQRALQRVIEQTLIFQEAEKLPTIGPRDEEVKSALAETVKLFASQSAFYERMGRVGLTSEQLTEIIRRRVAIEKYLDFRFRTFSFVTDEEVVDYYNNVYVPQQRRLAPDSIVPKLEEKKAELTEILRTTQIESDLNSFLEEAAQRAEIITLNPV